MTMPRNDMTNYWNTPNTLFNADLLNETICAPLQHLNTSGTCAQLPQFSSPISSPNGLQITNTQTHPQTGGLFDETGELAGRIHYGIDIAAEIGTGVVAAEDGVVVLAQEVGEYGKVVYVNHPGGYQTRYAHLSEINVKEGDVIKQGDLVGLVGKTGNANSDNIEPHVHFEVREILKSVLQDAGSNRATSNSQSTPLDPLPILLGQTIPQAAQMQPRQTPPKAPPPPPKKYPEPQKEETQDETQGKEEKKDANTVVANEQQSTGLSFKEKKKAEILEKLFNFMDADKNSSLSASEMKQRLLACLGQCGGVITEKNLNGILKNQAGLGLLGRDDATKALMSALDANGDGMLTSDEVDSMVQSIMSKCDQNGDQKISREELGRIS